MVIFIRIRAKHTKTTIKNEFHKMSYAILRISIISNKREEKEEEEEKYIIQFAMFYENVQKKKMFWVQHLSYHTNWLLFSLICSRHFSVIIIGVTCFWALFRSHCISLKLALMLHDIAKKMFPTKHIHYIQLSVSYLMLCFGIACIFKTSLVYLKKCLKSCIAIFIKYLQEILCVSANIIANLRFFFQHENCIQI